MPTQRLALLWTCRFWRYSCSAARVCASGRRRAGCCLMSCGCCAVYASNVQVQVDQKVGAIANTPTGLPPTAHLKTNPSHLVTCAHHATAVCLVLSRCCMGMMDLSRARIFVIDLCLQVRRSKSREVSSRGSQQARFHIFRVDRGSIHVCISHASGRAEVSAVLGGALHKTFCC